MGLQNYFMGIKLVKYSAFGVALSGPLAFIVLVATRLGQCVVNYRK